MFIIINCANVCWEGDRVVFNLHSDNELKVNTQNESRESRSVLIKIQQFFTLTEWEYPFYGGALEMKCKVKEFSISFGDNNAKSWSDVGSISRKISSKFRVWSCTGNWSHSGK